MSAEVIVIGAGIAGCSAALHLAEAGLSTMVIEKGEISSEASGVNMGGLGGVGWGNSPGLQEHLTMGSLNIFKRLQIGIAFSTLALINSRQASGFSLKFQL